jgi:hypothetical protein
LEDFGGSDKELFAEIEQLTKANGTAPSLETERRLVLLRHIAGIRLMDGAPDNAAHPKPDAARLPAAEGLPSIDAPDLTPELLRAGILRDGAVLARGLIDRDRALAFAAQIDRAFTERQRFAAGEPHDARYYDEFGPHPRMRQDLGRPWVEQGGGLLATDAPILCFELSELYHQGGVADLVDAYLGEPALGSLQKTTLRKSEPSVSGAWHQDGAFMGEVRSLNVWLSLSHCGDIAPGLDVVPRRLELQPRGTEGTFLSYQVSQQVAEAAAGDKPVVRPIFEPGDALLFDDLCLHQTASDPAMPNTRFAVESWFFGGSAFPEEWAPIAA